MDDGPLAVDIRVTTQRRLTIAALVEFLGAEEVEAMHNGFLTALACPT